MEKATEKAVVVFLEDKEGRWCLARKKQPIHNTLGEISYSLGMYNGYGGKEESEDRGDLRHTATREIYGESGVIVLPDNLEEIFSTCFYIPRDNEVIPFMEVVFFVSRVWEYDPKETEEMGFPSWFLGSQMPWEQMMPADSILINEYWRRKMYLQGSEFENPFFADVYLGSDKKSIPRVFFR